MERIEQVLGVLRGEPLRNMGRAANMAWLAIGDEDVEISRGRRGGTRMVPRYALHIQCPFRLSGPEGPIVASLDMYRSADDPLHYPPDDFDWDVAGANWYDAQVGRYLKCHAAMPHRVEAVEADACGGFHLALTGDHALDVFPATSFQRECWRYFECDKDKSHFVVFEDDDH